MAGKEIRREDRLKYVRDVERRKKGERERIIEVVGLRKVNGKNIVKVKGV